MRRIIILFALLAIASSMYAYDPVKISGKAPFAANQIVRIYQYDDLISYKRVIIGNVKVDKDGNFSTSLNLTRPTYIMFVINFLESELYVEPQKEYQIHFEFLNPVENAAEISAKEIPMLTIVENDDFKELNQQINMLNNAVADFLTQNNNFKRIYYRADKRQLDSLKMLIYGDWGSSTSDYFKTYQKYTFASYENIIYSKNSDSALVKYFNEKEIYTENTAFMLFFNVFFDKYYESPNSKLPAVEFKRVINEEPNLSKLLDLMGKDPVLKNEIIREMVLIKVLQNAFVDDRFDYRNVVGLLYELAETTKFQDHKKMAMNVIGQLKNKLDGRPILNYTLKNVNGSTTKLSEFKDKYIYIHFFTTDCNSCVRDMFGLQKIQDEFKDSVQIVSISLDMNTAKLFHFVNKYTQFNWPILSFANNFDFIEAYGLKGLPLTMFLDKSGNIIAFPAPTPEENLTQLFSYIYKDKYHHKAWFEPGYSTVKPIKKK